MQVAAQETPKALCTIQPVAKPGSFPDTPINIFIPRSQSSGALRLSAEIVANLPEDDSALGSSAHPPINLLFKSNGNLTAALDHFATLPTDGTNIIQLTDTYASHLADPATPAAHTGLVPIAIAQIPFSQIFIRTDDPRFSTLETFLRYARDADTPPLTIANFQTADGSTGGLEDFLIADFVTAYGIEEKQTAPGTSADASDVPAIEVAGYENGSQRYFSLFSSSAGAEPPSDALIEQPGDVARLIEGGLLTPIVTLLPESDVTDALATHPMIGQSAALPDDLPGSCNVHLRFRAYFVSQEVPEAHRVYLSWLFQSAINTPDFQEFNTAQYLDVLYEDEDIAAGYCSAERANALFQQSIENYRACQTSHATN